MRHDYCLFPRRPPVSSTTFRCLRKRTDLRPRLGPPQCGRREGPGRSWSICPWMATLPSTRTRIKMISYSAQTPQSNWIGIISVWKVQSVNLAAQILQDFIVREYFGSNSNNSGVEVPVETAVGLLWSLTVQSQTLQGNNLGFKNIVVLIFYLCLDKWRTGVTWSNRCYVRYF